MKNIFYMKGDHGSGSSWYRMDLPAHYLKGQYHTTCRVVMNNEKTDIELNEADLVIVQRQCHPDIKKFIRRKKAEGMKFLFEIDDNMWQYPFDNLARQYWTKERLDGMTEIVQLCHGVITTTPKMAEFLQSMNSNVYVIPNYIHKVRDIKNKQYDKETLTIGWAGSDTHKKDFTGSILQALIDIQEEISQPKIKLVFFGYIPEVMLGRAIYYKFAEPKHYLTQLAKLNFDIGIAPCELSEFNDYKSDIKFVEYGAVGAVTIASPIYPYEKVINGHNGMLVKDNSYQAWKTALNNLILHKLGRKTMTEEANDYARSRLIDRHYDEISKIYKEVMG